MAEDKVASLRTEVSESEKKLAEKMQGLKRKLIVDEIFVRTRRLPTKIILGPCFKNMFTTELSPHYPLAEGEKLLLHSAEPDWFKDKTLRSWPNVSGMWIDWVDRVEKAKWEVWKSADIYDAIQLSKHDIPLDKNLLYGALCYWSISTNSFHFRFGMMGPTVLDIVALTGLRPHGEDVSVPLGVAKSARDLPEYTKIKECLTYCKFLDVSMGAMAVTEEEHISFLVMWLCRYLFCNSSITMIEQCTKLALALSKGRKLALAPFVLSNLYHACTDIVTGGFDDARGPFWILQLWLQAYFPEHQPSTLDDGSPLTYGHALVDGVLRPKTFSQYFLFFNKCSSRTASQFTPFSSRKFGPEWFKRSLDPYFQKLNRTELKDIWASYLIARDLPYSICMDESSKCKCMVEHYSPNQFARQFGMTQAIPFYQSANDSISKENFRDDSEETESRFSQLKREFSFVPFNVNPSSTDFFDFWWSTYMNNRDKTTTATDVLRKISLYVTPLGSSEKQEVAAHRSNGIKGNSQSAGKFVRNMKRKYEGYSIPSRSFVQQNDESGQQKNSYEVAEKISIKSTICKKMKTSAMKMPLLRTTSSVPFASAFLTSRASADEDETKADEQVSDANDTSTSALSSTSEKEGEKCTVSPSLAETESKASDVSEPPDCPVKFDNLEDFFARVSGQIKQAQSLGFSADHSSPIDENTSAMQKSTPSAEMLATAKEDIERLLIMPSQDLLQPENCSKLTAALSVYIASSDLSVERALAFEKLKENLPHLSSTYHRAKKDREDYYKKAAKKVILIDELTKGQEHYANLKDYSDKLECTTDSIRNQIRKLKASLKDAKTKRKAIQDQKLSLAKKCFEKSNALDEMEAESPEMKEIADSDIARVEEILTELKSKIKSNRVCKSLFHVNLLSSDP
ncbi:uncharacterized protein [Solanum lycopersicum]|uniref:Aminotransferase-like plant mobile domain-containing protein n=1 Tax=Solanum lycopersicum TaxID=4081 RepID=A0A3Q7IT85_SOLLC|nr:uncharacterized protein LOC104649076 [Solanum lycopersicum]XP_025888795.1 uncharacterized protein LOC104649076 [Solanum lycopersicum]